MKSFFRSLKNLIRTIDKLIKTPPAHLPPHCSNISALLLHLCDGDAELHKWILRWIAYPLRHPGAKMSTCLVFNGGEGAGKSMLFEYVVAQAYGTFARRVQGHHLRNIFNGWTVGAQMVIVDGEYSRAMAMRLKSLVTESRILVNERNKPERAEQNQMNFVFLSGAVDFLPAEVSDRRFVVVEVPPKQSPWFYRAVNDEIQNGGVEAFRHYLLHELDMTDFDEYTRPPGAGVSQACRQAA